MSASPILSFSLALLLCGPVSRGLAIGKTRREKLCCPVGENKGGIFVGGMGSRERREGKATVGVMHRVLGSF